MKAFVATCLLLVASFHAVAQFDPIEEEPRKAEEKPSKWTEKAAPNPYKLALKIVPFAPLDLSLGTAQIGVEWQFKEFSSLNADLGFRPRTENFRTEPRKRSRGIKARVQLRHYVERKVFRGFYSGVEAFYKYQEFDYEVVYGYGCNNTSGLNTCSYYEFKDTRIEQHASSLGFLFGFQPLAAAKGKTWSRFIFDVNTSIGLRWVRENYPGVTDDVTVFDTESRLAEFRTFESSTNLLYPNIGFTLRIGWWIS